MSRPNIHRAKIGILCTEAALETCIDPAKVKELEETLERHKDDYADASDERMAMLSESE